MRTFIVAYLCAALLLLTTAFASKHCDQGHLGKLKRLRTDPNAPKYCKKLSAIPQNKHGKSKALPNDPFLQLMSSSLGYGRYSSATLSASLVKDFCSCVKYTQTTKKSSKTTTTSCKTTARTTKSTTKSSTTASTTPSTTPMTTPSTTTSSTTTSSTTTSSTTTSSTTTSSTTTSAAPICTGTVVETADQGRGDDPFCGRMPSSYTGGDRIPDFGNVGDPGEFCRLQCSNDPTCNRYVLRYEFRAPYCYFSREPGSRNSPTLEDGCPEPGESPRVDGIAVGFRDPPCVDGTNA